MVVVKDDRSPCPLPDPVEINDTVATGLVIILDRQAASDALREQVNVLAPPIDRLVLLAEHATEVNIDLRLWGPGKTHDVHDLTVNPEIADAVLDDMLVGRGQAVELAWMKRDALPSLERQLTDLLELIADGRPVRQLVELVLGSPWDHIR
jgi:hypothetical protein